jgi:hypothetical protein
MNKAPLLSELRGGYYKEHHLKAIIKQARQEADQHYRQKIRELWDDVVCPLCYRLNPHHASENKGKGCNWCGDKKYYTGQSLEEALKYLEDK